VIKRLALSLPAVLTAGSFLALAIIVSTTNPTDKIAYAMFFFLFLTVFLIGAGYLLIRRIRGKVSPRNRYRLFIISICLVILLMFRSAQSLSWVDGLVLAALALGMLFYSGRRT
jgi:peptidoglycan/LPS O-acetylase OafA/YrhL